MIVQKKITIALVFIASMFLIAFFVIYNAVSANGVLYYSMLYDLKNNPIYYVLLKKYPSAKEELDAILKKYSGDFIEHEFLSEVEVWSEKYLNKSVLQATDDSIYNLLRVNVENLEKLRYTPELCVTYYLKNDKNVYYSLPSHILQSEENRKIEIIKSASSKIIFKKDKSRLLELLNAKYANNQYNRENISKLDVLDKIPEDEACEIAIEFSKMLASFNKENGAFIFKSFNVN